MRLSHGHWDRLVNGKQFLIVPLTSWQKEVGTDRSSSGKDKLDPLNSQLDAAGRAQLGLIVLTISAPHPGPWDCFLQQALSRACPHCVLWD